MKKKICVLFFVVHLLLIFFKAMGTTINGYWRYHYNRPPNFIAMGHFNKLPTDLYSMFSGTDTGYGFYGIKTATVKYVRVKYLDSNDTTLKLDRYFNLSTSNGISRFGGYSSYLANYIAETEKLVKANDVPSSNIRETIKFREDYIEKVFKWLGEKEAKATPGCVAYSIELLTIVPEDIRQRQSDLKPEMYVIKKGLFPVQ
jgi:hypothetical protein